MADSRISNSVPGRPYVTPGGVSYPFQSEVTANGDGYLDKGARSLCLLPSANYGTAIPLAASLFSTEFVSSMALDITVSALTGGTAVPTATFLLDRQGLDGNWYNILTTAAATAATSYSIDVGNFSVAFGGTNTAQHAVFTYNGRLRWTFAAGGTGATFSASVVGRN